MKWKDRDAAFETMQLPESGQRNGVEEVAGVKVGSWLRNKLSLSLRSANVGINNRGVGKSSVGLPVRISVEINAVDGRL